MPFCHVIVVNWLFGIGCCFVRCKKIKKGEEKKFLFWADKKTLFCKLWILQRILAACKSVFFCGYGYFLSAGGYFLFAVTRPEKSLQFN